MKGEVFFYVQYLLGVGHLQRSLRIAEALVGRGFRVAVVSGGMPAPLAIDRGIDFVQLPPIRARDARFALVDDKDAAVDDALRDHRRRALLKAFAAARPDAVITEGFPFARRAFRFELDALILAAQQRRPRPRLICSLRDIVARRDDPERHREIVARVSGDFDAVLVHGDPRFIPLDASFAAAPQIANRTVYTGYIAPAQLPEESGSAPATGEVIVSAGGGAAGLALLETALAARRSGCLEALSWRLLTGTHLPEADFAVLRNAAPAGVVVERFRADLPALLRHCRVSVSQAGYNTVLEVLAAGVRAVLVPFAAERETEQLLRAERLAQGGAIELVRESELSPATLAAAIERAVARPPAFVEIDRAGATRSAGIIAAMIEGVPPAALGLVTAAREGIIAQ